jgi:hypothetical protein
LTEGTNRVEEKRTERRERGEEKEKKAPESSERLFSEN